MTRNGRDRQREQLEHQRLPRSEQTVLPLFEFLFVRTCKCFRLCALVKGIRKRGRVRIAPCTLPQAGPLPARHSLTVPVLRDELSNQSCTRPVPAFPHHRQPLMVLGIFKRHPRTSPWLTMIQLWHLCPVVKLTALGTFCSRMVSKHNNVTVVAMNSVFCHAHLLRKRVNLRIPPCHSALLCVPFLSSLMVPFVSMDSFIARFAHLQRLSHSDRNDSRFCSVPSENGQSDTSTIFRASCALSSSAVA